MTMVLTNNHSLCIIGLTSLNSAEKLSRVKLVSVEYNTKNVAGGPVELSTCQ